MSKFASALLNWYGLRKRALPWRDHPDPYAVWISEVMLQQTRVEAVRPYFDRWMKEYPTITALSRASEQEVLIQWEGLGYYARARNLRKAAQELVLHHAAMLPRDVHALRKLPGIGRYTAGAIASMAFGADEPALDGNIRRVLARAFNVTQSVDSPDGEAELWRLASRHLPHGQAGDYNQALMDLGATVCLASVPRCPECPGRSLCKARKLGVQARLPIRARRTATPHHLAAAVVITRRASVLVSKRPSKGLLGGMWEFPSVRVQSVRTRSLPSALQAVYGLDAEIGEALGSLEHAYTHFSVTVHIFRCKLLSVPSSDIFRWVPISRLGELPMGRVDREIARKLA